MKNNDFIDLRHQAPTSRPASGTSRIRADKDTGAIVLVDADGTETVIGGGNLTATTLVMNNSGGTGTVTLTTSADVGANDEFALAIPAYEGLLAAVPATAYANDSAAASGGIAVGELYKVSEGGVFRVRMT